METNTIIRTEDSINMGGSFLNETQVRLAAGSLVSSDPDIKSELHGDITAVMCILHSHIIQFRIAGSVNPALQLQPIYCRQVLSLSRCLHYCCTYPLCNTAVFDERMDSTEVTFFLRFYSQLWCYYEPTIIPGRQLLPV